MEDMLLGPRWIKARQSEHGGAFVLFWLFLLFSVFLVFLL